MQPGASSTGSNMSHCSDTGFGGHAGGDKSGGGAAGRRDDGPCGVVRVFGCEGIEVLRVEVIGVWDDVGEGVIMLEEAVVVDVEDHPEEEVEVVFLCA